MAEVLEVEARLKDFISANLETIVKKLDATAKAIDSTAKSADDMGKKVEAMGNKISNTGGFVDASFTKMFSAVFSADAVMNLIGKSWGKLNEIAKEGIDYYKEYTNANSKLEGVLRATGNTIGFSTTALKNMQVEMTATGGETKAEIANAQALLLTFSHIGRDTFPRAMEAASDLSAVMGGDLNGAIRMVGMALDSPEEGMMRLSRAGIRFTEVQKEQIKEFIAAGQGAKAQELILAELEKRFGGVEAAMLKTDVGQLAVAERNLKEISAELGSNLIPLLTTFANLTNKAVGGINDTVVSWKVLLGMRLNDPIKDMTFLNAEIDKFQSKIGKPANWFDKIFSNPEAMQKMFKEQVDYLTKQKEELQQVVQRV